jgi:hypothetical protein
MLVPKSSLGPSGLILLINCSVISSFNGFPVSGTITTRSASPTGQGPSQSIPYSSSPF